MRAIGRAALAARPVALADAVAEAGLLTRHDRIYFVPHDVFPGVASQLTAPGRPGGAFRALSINGRRWFRHHVVHYDTPGLEFYRDRGLEGERFDASQRLYEESGTRQFEVKVTGWRGDVVKHRIGLEGAGGSLSASARDLLAEVLDDAYGLGVPGHFQPVVATDFQRATFTVAGVRITCDAGHTVRDLEAGTSVRADTGVVRVVTRTAGPPTAADVLLAPFASRGADVATYRGALGELRPELPVDALSGAGRSSR
ncbi:hypothetical protein ACFXDJ_06090 [Streptomyces sp. NPDC059443]|uniref:hypothetical protein n=1 Tax=unclassified Streptomyces TaxID=2593676 RepID=UPI0036BE6C6C